MFRLISLVRFLGFSFFLALLFITGGFGSSEACTPTVLFDFDGDQPESPGVLQPGESATFGWRVDVSNCDATDYRLVFAFYDTEESGFGEGVGASFSTQNPKFDLSKGDNGIIYAKMLAAPQNEGK